MARASGKFLYISRGLDKHETGEISFYDLNLSFADFKGKSPMISKNTLKEISSEQLFKENINEVIDNPTFQDNVVTYYPEEYHFTRITDFKYLNDEYMDTTTIQIEYPTEYDETSPEGNVPFYPIPTEKNKIIYEKYKNLTKEYENITFIGRLCEYKILQMDEIVEKVLNLMGEKFTGLTTEY